MKFAELAQYLQKLEGTASRNEMTVILAELFAKASPEDAKLIAYLSAGRMGPAYNCPDFGVADKMMLKALGEKSLDIFKQTGDLGLTAEKLKSEQGKHNPQEISEVFQKLLAIAHASGAGSQEKKQLLIRELIEDLDPVGAKYAVKMILGKLRVGFSDMTVLDSLSWMKTGNKSLRKAIENIYNVRADLGEVTKLVKDHEDLTHLSIKPKIGVPILMARCERATTAEDIWERNGRCAVEYKLDGFRIQAHIRNGKVQMFSRGLEDMADKFPEIVEGLLKQVKGDAIVEGEVIAVDKNGHFLPFQETISRKRKYDIVEMMAKMPLKMYLFDILSLDGEALLTLSNSDRWAILEKIYTKGTVIELITRQMVDTVEDIKNFYNKAIADGTEGIIAKKIDGIYQAGSRDFNWIKYKASYSVSALADTIDAVVMGYDVGQGKRAGFGIGDFLIGVYDSENDSYKTIAKIGTGLTDEEWRKMKVSIDELHSESKPENYFVNKVMNVDVWAKPKIVVEVHSDEITKSPMHTSGLALRFPRLLSWREKQPQDATTVIELEKMFQKQSEVA
jgi:DNA ligase 1